MLYLMTLFLTPLVVFPHPSSFFYVTVHFRLKAYEFSNWNTARFVLELTNDLLVVIAIIW